MIKVIMKFFSHFKSHLLFSNFNVIEKRIDFILFVEVELI